jgi:hypothetical protein
MFINGEIDGYVWNNMRGDVLSKVYEASRVLHESTYYNEVPLTLEERKAYYEKQGVVIGALTPDEELLNYYYELKPQSVINPETGRLELDFDTYYAQVSNLLNSIDPAFKERLLATMHLNWTPMEKLYYDVSNTYLRSYRNLRSAVRYTYTPEEQHIIELYYGRNESAAPEEYKPLIRDYNSKLSTARKNLRYANPTLDAWLNFFGTVTVTQTTEAAALLADLKKQYLVESMVD